MTAYFLSDFWPFALPCAFSGCLRAKMSCLGHLDGFLRLLLLRSIVTLFHDYLGCEQVLSRCITILFLYNFSGSLFLSGLGCEQNQLWVQLVEIGEIHDLAMAFWSMLLLSASLISATTIESRRKCDLSISQVQILPTFFLLVEDFCQQIVSQRISRQS